MFSFCSFIAKCSNLNDIVVILFRQNDKREFYEQMRMTSWVNERVANFSFHDLGLLFLKGCDVSIFMSLEKNKYVYDLKKKKFTHKIVKRILQPSVLQ